MESTKQQKTKEVEALVKKVRLKKSEILKMERALNRFIVNECKKIDVQPSLIKAIIK